MERRGVNGNKEVKWKPLSGGAQEPRRGKSLNEEIEWRLLYGGAQGRAKFK